MRRGKFPGGPVARTLVLLLMNARVQSLVGELKSHKLRGMVKKEKKKKRINEKKIKQAGLSRWC